MGTNLYYLPCQIAAAHDAAQTSQLNKMNQEIESNNRLMREHLYQILHEISAYLREDKEEYDLSGLEERITELNKLYKEYREEFLNEARNGSSIDDGALNELFPENLTDISPYALRKAEGKIKEWLDYCKNFNNQKTQDLYLMIQIGVALLTAFQNTQREMGESARHMVRNQRA